MLLGNMFITWNTVVFNCSGLSSVPVCRCIVLQKAGDQLGLHQFTSTAWMCHRAAFRRIVTMHRDSFFNSSGPPLLQSSGDTFLMRANILLRGMDDIRRNAGGEWLHLGCLRSIAARLSSARVSMFRLNTRSTDNLTSWVQIQRAFWVCFLYLMDKSSWNETDGTTETTTPEEDVMLQATLYPL